MVIAWLLEDARDVEHRIIEPMNAALKRWAAARIVPPVFVVAAREIQPGLARELIEAGATIMTEV